MPDIDRTRWDLVALQKLTSVLGAKLGEQVYVETLRELLRERLETPNDLYRFAQRVAKRGGFIGAVGGLLTVHSVIHGAAEPAGG